MSVYFHPQPYVCPKGHQAYYSQSESFPAPVLLTSETNARGQVFSRAEPVCPECYAEFLRANVSLMRPDDRREDEE